MKKYFVLFAALLSLGLAACLSSGSADNAHNARNSLNWAGTYSGITPAADCPGINVRLTLNADETFELVYSYVERSGGPYTEKGKFTWDKAGGTVTLRDADGYPPHFKVGENRLIQLDMKGKLITGILANNYVLNKTR